MQEHLETLGNETHPIDCVEEVLTANNWTFERTHDDELVVEVSGKGSAYRLFFIWQENMNALQFGCHYDVTIDENNIKAASETVLAINQNLWIGHFDLPKETRTPIFRYTCIFHGAGRASAAETIEDMVDISLVQCERYYPTFDLLTNQEMTLDSQSIALALMETAGES